MRFRIPAFIAEDFLRKLVALFFAILAWLSIYTQLLETYTLRNVPVKLEYDRDAILVEDGGFTVDVELKGSPRSLEGTTSSDFLVVARIPSDIPPGQLFTEVGISSRNVTRRASSNVHVTGVSPRKLEVRIDRIVTKQDIPVRVRFDGELNEGFKRTRCTVSPSTVVLKGPEKILRDVWEVVTEAVVLDETVVRGFEEDVSLTRIPSVQMPGKVHINVEVAKLSSQQAFRGLPIDVLKGREARLRVTNPLPEASATIHGPKLMLDKLSPGAIHPFVDLTGITSPGRYRMPVQVWIDGGEGLSCEYTHPSLVELTVAMEPTPEAAGPDPGKLPGPE